jgi:acyl carrier protein
VDRSWSDFVRDLAGATRTEADRLQRGTRLIHDLDLDSLALAEVAVLLLVDYELAHLPERLEESGWNELTVGDLFEECRSTESTTGWSVRLE